MTQLRNDNAELDKQEKELIEQLYDREKRKEFLLNQQRILNPCQIMEDFASEFYRRQTYDMPSEIDE